MSAERLSFAQHQGLEQVAKGRAVHVAWPTLRSLHRRGLVRFVQVPGQDGYYVLTRRGAATNREVTHA